MEGTAVAIIVTIAIIILVLFITHLVNKEKSIVKIGYDKTKYTFCKNCKYCTDELCTNENNCVEGDGFEDRGSE